MGYATTASGDWSTAMGELTEASGQNSTATGYKQIKFNSCCNWNWFQPLRALFQKLWVCNNCKWGFNGYG